MKTLVQIRSSLIAKLKNCAPLAAYHSNFPVEIRELSWQGQDFKYPCVRIGQTVLTPKNTTCSMLSAEGTIMAFSELPSSLEVENIADIIFEELHGHSFGIAGIKFAGMSCQRFEAVRVEESGVWQSTIKWSATVS